MANNKGNINFKIGTEIDKTGLNDLKKELLELKSLTQAEALNLNKAMKPEEVNKELANLKGTISKIEEALKKAFNPKLGTTNIKTFGEELKKLDVDKIYKQLSSFGTVGQSAFRKISSEALATNVQLKQTHKVLDEIAVTMKNTIKWGFSASVMDTFSSKISESWEFAKKLDTSLNDIRIVTGKSAEEMKTFAKEANDAAKALGTSTTDITQASLIYYQQGLSDQEANARAEITAKVANVTGESASEASEQLTAIWNGYKVSAEEAELYIDKVAKVAATTAADLEEMSTAMSKVASAANSAGVDIDQLNGMLSTVVSVTREAPETIGSSFKTIFARIGDLELNGQDEYGVSLGKVSSQMEELGIQILDQQGQMRNMGDIIEDTAEKWQTWTRAQKQAAAIAMAGKMQYSRLIALFDDWNMYEKAVSDSQNAVGTLQEQQDIYMESTAAHLEKINASFEGMSESLFDMDSVNAFADVLSVVLDRVADLFDGLGGGLNVLETFGSLGLTVFKKQIAGGLETTIQNFRAAKENVQQFEAQLSNIEELKNSTAYKEDPVIKDLVDKTEQAKKYYEVLDTGRQQELNNAIKVSVEANNELQVWKDKKKFAEEFGQAITQNENFSFDGDNFDEYQEAIPRLQEHVKILSEEYKKLEDNSEQAFKVFKSEDKDLINNYFEKIKKSADNYLKKIEEIKNLNESTFATTRGQEVYDDVYNLEKVLTEIKATKAEDFSQEDIEKLSSSIEKATGTLKTFKYEVAELGETSKEIFENRDMKTNVLEEKVDKTNKKLEDTLNKAKEISNYEKGITIASSLGALQSAMSTLQSFHEIINDSSISSAEKYNKIVSTLVFQIPALAGQVKELIPVIKSLGMAGNFAFAGVSALIVALNLYSSYKQNQIQKAKDIAKDTEEELNNLKEEQAVFEENAKSFKSLYESFKETGDGKEELDEITKELCETLNIELDALDNLSDKYDEVNKKIKEQKLLKEQNIAEQAGMSVQDARVSLEKTADLGTKATSTKGLLSTASDILSGDVKAGANFYNNLQMSGYKEFGTGLSTNDEKAINDYLVKALESKGYTVDKTAKEGSLQGVYGLNSDNIEQFYRDLSDINKEIIKESATNKELKSNMVEGELYSSLKDIISESADAIAQIDEGKKQEKESLINISAQQRGVDEVSSIKEYEQLRIDMIKDLNEAMKAGNAKYSLKDIEDYWTSNENLKQYDQGYKYKQQILEKTGDRGSSFENALNNLSNESLSILVSLDIDEDTTEENLNRALESVQLKADEKEIKTNLSIAQSVYSKVSQGKEPTSKEEKENAEELEKKYSDLNEAFLRYGRSSKQYTEILRSHMEELEKGAINTTQALENNKLKDLAENIKVKKEEKTVKVKIDESEFREDLDEILDQDYTVAIDIKADVDSDFDYAVNKIEEVEKAAEKIGENFVVANEDLRELNQTFPGIVKNVQDLGDGTSRLSEEMVKLATESAQQGIENSNKETIAKLNNSKEELQVKLQVAKRTEELARKLAKNEYESQKEKAKDILELNQNLSSLETDSNKKASEAQIKNNGTVASKLVSNFSSMGSNATKTAQSIANSFFESAKNIISNFKEVKKATSGDETAKATQTTIKNTLNLTTDSIAKGVANAISNLKSYTKQATNVISNMTATNWEKIADNAAAQAAAYEDMISDIDGEIAELSSRGESLASAFDRIRSGQAGKTSTKKGSSKDPNTIDDIKDKKDAYHDIDIVLKQISNELDILQQQEKKMSGKALIENLNKQLNVLQRQIESTGDKISVAKQEAQKLKNELSIDGVSFNTDGTISNYSEVYDKQLNYLNSLVSAYNSMSAEEQEKYKDVVDTAKQDFNDLIDNMKEYDKTITETIPGLEKDIQSAIDKQIEIKISEFDMEIKVGLNLAEAQRDWNNFKKKVIDQIKDTDILGNTKAKIDDFLTYYSGGLGGVIQQNTSHVNEIIAQLQTMEATGSSPIYGDNQSQAMDDLKTYYEQLMSDLISVENLVGEIKESYLDMMDEASSAFSEQQKMYDSLASTINHDMKLIELVYGDTMYKELGNYYEKMVEVNNSQLDFQKQQVELWAEQMELLEENSDEWKKAKESWLDAVSQWETSLENAIENIKNKYENTINEIFKDLNNELTNGAGLDYVNTEWELINKNSDEYLDNINSAYEIQKLQNKYTQAINNTDNIVAQRELQKVMEIELAALREKDKLTKYDLERAELQYQIELKKVSLEESQRNKSTLKLKRDSQGNYNYQYTTNKDEIADLQQELSDLYNQLYNLDISAYKENLNKVYDVWVEFQEAMKDAAQINDPQEREERELLLKDQYSKLVTGIVEQNETIRSNLYESTFLELSELYDTDILNLEEMTKDEGDILMEKMVPQWNSSLQQMTNGFKKYTVTTKDTNNTMVDALGNQMKSFVSLCETSYSKIRAATQTYEKELNNLQTVAGADFSKISQGIDNNINKTQKLLDKNNEVVSAYKSELSEIADVIKSLDSLSVKYSKARQDAIDATNAAKEYWRQQQEIAQNIAHLNDSQRAVSSSDMAAQNGYNGDSSNSFIQSTSSQGNGSLDIGDTATFTGKYYYDSYGSTPAGSRYSGVDHGVVIDRINNNTYGVHIHSADGRYPDLGWVKRSQLSGFDTGGYTGEWGNDGKLALLHQKELVLNANDTENFLAGIEILRNITNSFGESILSKMNSQNFNLNGIAQDLNQNVHIEASFPNVTNHNEIEIALKNLTNKASMYIHK